MMDAKSLSTPLEVNCELDNSRNERSCNVPYQSLVGCLMYMTVTSRPDIANAASYLRTLYLSLCYTKTSDAILGFVDVDWAQNHF
ncbi:hypothetical protein PR048_010801 [Dryococelus australis]|uniref:Uncharacterized protein n=1 Tax=Dryococelus australis TaxID=614101 RepID=A0ABQ9I3P8_9NEOP|nr:hypothetical protein PR048_010801 [Dryococelus australis]